MKHVVTFLVWVVLGVPVALAATRVAGRLLGVRRGWVSLAVAGAIGWAAGILLAGALTSWEWSTAAMVLLTLLFGTFLTMVTAIGVDMLALPGTLARGDAAGRVVLTTPGRAWRASVAPLGRYRELLGIARANGLLRRHTDLDDPSAIAALGPPLRRTLETAGGMFVKLGQVASTRSDLLPPDLCAQLALLRASAAPAPEAEARKVIEDELGQPVDDAFARFDGNPIASASVAQVYAATMHDGTRVVVKVERPGIAHVIERDSAVLDQVANAIERHTTLGLSIKPTDIADEFIAGVREELDFGIEIANASALAAATPPGSGVRVPRTYPALSTARVLVEERIDGVSIADVAALRGMGHDPAELAQRLLRVFLQQIFDRGVFHADPHPGNILVEPDGTIALIDLGAVGHLGRTQQQLCLQLLAGAMNGDAMLVRESLDEAGLIAGTVKSSELDTAIDEFLARYIGSGTMSGSIFEDMFAMLGTFGIRPARWMTTLGRTFVTLDGTLHDIDPDFRLIPAAVTFAQERMRTMVQPATLKESVEAEAARQLPRLRRLPQRIDEILGQASKGKLTARVSLFAGDDDLRTITRLVNRTVLAILTAAIGVGSTLLLNVEVGPAISDSVSVPEVIGFIGLATASVLSLRLVAAIIRDGVT